METLCGPIVPDPSCTVIAARRRRWQLRVPLLTQRASGVEGDEQRPAPSCALHGTAHTAVHGIHMDHCVAVGCMGAEVPPEVRTWGRVPGSLRRNTRARREPIATSDQIDKVGQKT